MLGDAMVLQYIGSQVDLEKKFKRLLDFASAKNSANEALKAWSFTILSHHKKELTISLGKASESY